MAQDTFAQMWNRVLLFAPDTPPFIAQQLVKDIHTRIVDHHYWSELKVDDEFNVPDWYSTGTVAWTQGGTTITGTGTLWNTGGNVSLYQQIQLGNLGNFFTITAINSDTEIEVERSIPYDTATGKSYHIGQLYIEFPTDMEVLELVRDRANAWRVMTQFYSQEYLDRIDPNRTSTGTPTLLAYASNRVDSSGNQIPRMELWPAPSASQNYVYRYRKSTSLSSATDRGLEMVPVDCYTYGALMLLALWPGTKEHENRYFSIEQHRELSKQFEETLNHAVVADHDRDQRMITYGLGEERQVPIDAKYIQAHGI